ncbi:MAG: hypothetical protein K8F24_03915 [Bacteroidales bacterium]|nr:hypothetical protein [Bacteroidales bacterium]
MPDLLIQISGWILAALLVLATLFSWILLLSGKFKTAFIMPWREGEPKSKGKVWFVLQSFGLAFAAFIAGMRIGQLLEGHRDNVIENLVYAVSGMLFIRVLGEFKYMGLFRSVDAGEFTRIDKRWLTPYAAVCFVLSWVLL